MIDIGSGENKGKNLLKQAGILLYKLDLSEVSVCRDE